MTGKTPPVPRFRIVQAPGTAPTAHGPLQVHLLGHHGARGDHHLGNLQPDDFHELRTKSRCDLRAMRIARCDLRARVFSLRRRHGTAVFSSMYDGSSGACGCGWDSAKVFHGCGSKLDLKISEVSTPRSHGLMVLICFDPCCNFH